MRNYLKLIEFWLQEANDHIHTVSEVWELKLLIANFDGQGYRHLP